MSKHLLWNGGKLVVLLKILERSISPRERKTNKRIGKTMVAMKKRAITLAITERRRFEKPNAGI